MSTEVPPGGADLFPVFLDISKKQCLVVGGGNIAVAKAASLARCGADVTIIAPKISSDNASLATTFEGQGGSVRIERRTYMEGDASHYRIVVTATGRPDIDGAVAEDCGRAGVWVNSVDDPFHCEFHVPSVYRDGPVAIAVSTAGSSPALATWLRKRIASFVGTDLGLFARLLEETRRRLQRAGHPTSEFNWTAILDGPALDLIRSGNLSAARQAIDATLPTDVEPSRPDAGSP